MQPKCFAQMQMQMHFANKSKRYLCVASPTFEADHGVRIVEVHHDNEYVTDLLRKCEKFWLDRVLPHMKNMQAWRKWVCCGRTIPPGAVWCARIGRLSKIILHWSHQPSGRGDVWCDGGGRTDALLAAAWTELPQEEVRRSVWGNRGRGNHCLFSCVPAPWVQKWTISKCYHLGLFMYVSVCVCASLFAVLCIHSLYQWKMTDKTVFIFLPSFILPLLPSFMSESHQTRDTKIRHGWPVLVHCGPPAVANVQLQWRRGTAHPAHCATPLARQHQLVDCVR